MNKTKECQSCGASFRVWQEIDGVMKSLQRRRYCLECSPYKSGSKRRLSRYRTIDEEEHKRCPKCQCWKSLREFYNTSAYCRLCHNDHSRNKMAEYKRKAVEHLGDRCCDCGVSYGDHIYDFHHLDPSTKDFKLSQLRSHTLETIRAELDKCVLLCSNCHRDRHYNPENPHYSPIRLSSALQVEYE